MIKLIDWFSSILLIVVVIIVIVWLAVLHYEKPKVQNFLPTFSMDCDGECDQGLECQGNICLKKLGQNCVTILECVTEAKYCNGVCSVENGLFQSCVNTPCDEGLVCLDGVCKGDDGFKCNSSLECVGYCDNGICKKKKAIGETCKVDDECTSGNCLKGICQHENINVPGEEGSYCNSNNDCANDLACSINNSCQQTVGWIQDCSVMACERRFVCDNTKKICTFLPLSLNQNASVEVMLELTDDLEWKTIARGIPKGKYYPVKNGFYTRPLYYFYDFDGKLYDESFIGIKDAILTFKNFFVWIENGKLVKANLNGVEIERRKLSITPHGFFYEDRFDNELLMLKDENGLFHLFENFAPVRTYNAVGNVYSLSPRFFITATQEHIYVYSVETGEVLKQVQKGVFNDFDVDDPGGTLEQIRIAVMKSNSLFINDFLIPWTSFGFVMFSYYYPRKIILSTMI